ncbi:MAG: AmpG family muropeptide MFS transporter [Zoogloeaceae bacterium]|jgi:PAT family beta-lactamase induction signal transducer AmpG|nr:AmpG family muropeptide MFS transporter [Zoogloeaceae bacterium]
MSLLAWLQPLLTRRMLICVFTGFSSGLPLFLLLQLMPVWLRSAEVDLKTIGFMTLVQFPFTWKFLWAPLLERYTPPLGLRRGWMLITQIGLFIVIGCIGGFDPKRDIWLITLLASILAFLAATQDIAIDAFRREMLTENEMDMGNSVHVSAYRAAGLVPGSLSLILSDHLPWAQVFWITALFMLPGMLMALMVTEPAVKTPPKNLREACVLPFQEFMQRLGWRHALLILAFLVLYKLGDSFATALSSVFYLEMGFSKTHIGLIAKHAALWPTIIGCALGGLIMVRIGVNRALWVFGVVQLMTILGFAWLADIGPQTEIKTFNLVALAVVISAEYLGVGLGTAAFIAFIARTTHPAYTATQFALFTGLASMPRTLINATAGGMAELLGWFNFFLLCTVLAVPGMLLLLKIAPWRPPCKRQCAPDDAGRVPDP